MAYRDLTPAERAVLARLLEPEFPGNRELRMQLDVVKAATIDEDGGLALQCDEGCPRAKVRASVPTEAEYRDSDGVPVHILLHVAEGVMNELEVFKEERTPILRREPEPSELALFTPYGSEGGA